MARLSIAPTRSNLMRMRQMRKLAHEGYEILDKKREVLTAELMRVAHEAAQQQTTVWESLAYAYRSLETARVLMGREHLEWTSLSTPSSMEVEVTPRSIMGVVIPSVVAHVAPPVMPYGLGNTPVVVDEARDDFRHILEQIPALAEQMTTVWRLARELQKTQRRVNALEHVFIPLYDETVEFIENALEEREREEVFRLKRLKSSHRAGGDAMVGPEEREYAQPYRDVGAGRKTVVYDFET